MTKYRVVRIDNGRKHPSTGEVGQFATQEEANLFIGAANKKLRSTAGYADARHPYAVQRSVKVMYTDGTEGEIWEYVK